MRYGAPSRKKNMILDEQKEHFGGFITMPYCLKHLKTCLTFKQCKLATVVESDSKAPFSIATTPRCRGGCYSFLWIAPLKGMNPIILPPAMGK